MDKEQRLKLRKMLVGSEKRLIEATKLSISTINRFFYLNKGSSDTRSLILTETLKLIKQIEDEEREKENIAYELTANGRKFSGKNKADSIIKWLEDEWSLNEMFCGVFKDENYPAFRDILENVINRQFRKK